jgi:thiol-disulfide isomerase/thioredoxin
VGDGYAHDMSTVTSPARLSAAYLKSKHDAGLTYEDYLATDRSKEPRWREKEQLLRLTDDQLRLIGGFVRPMRVLCVSGIWCGDCVVQGPMLHRIAQANPQIIDLKFVDRDEHIDLAEAVRINDGLRVPTVIWMAEDYELVSILGDRTLTRYRAVAAKQLGASCPLPGAHVPTDELKATMQEWLDEFERVHLLLRLSARLRQIHND